MRPVSARLAGASSPRKAAARGCGRAAAEPGEQRYGYRLNTAPRFAMKRTAAQRSAAGRMGEKMLGVYQSTQPRQRPDGTISYSPRRIRAWFSGVSATESRAHSQINASLAPWSCRSKYSPSPRQQVQASDATSCSGSARFGCGWFKAYRLPECSRASSCALRLRTPLRPRRARRRSRRLPSAYAIRRGGPTRA